MATRPIYIPQMEGPCLVKTAEVDFQWHAGFSASQKKKSVQELHQAAMTKKFCQCPLEVSSKSERELGVHLSAFNLKFETKKYKKILTVETAFQASKVFQDGGPYIDLLDGTSREAKKDPRLKTSGDLVRFVFFGEEWPLEPKTAFYDWVYMNALHKNQELVEQLTDFDAFTDIEFNPQKSINCQAYSVALYRALENRGIIREALADKAAYFEVLASFSGARSSDHNKKAKSSMKEKTPATNTPEATEATQTTLI